MPLLLFLGNVLSEASSEPSPSSIISQSSWVGGGGPSSNGAAAFLPPHLKQSKEESPRPEPSAVTVNLKSQAHLKDNPETGYLALVDCWDEETFRHDATRSADIALGDDKKNIRDEERELILPVATGDGTSNSLSTLEKNPDDVVTTRPAFQRSSSSTAWALPPRDEALEKRKGMISSSVLLLVSLVRNVVLA